MKDSGPPPIGMLLLALAVLALGGPALQGWFAAHGHCAPFSHGILFSRYSRARCFLFRDDRWDALLAAAVGAGALLALRRVGRAEAALLPPEDVAHRTRVIWFLRAVAAISLTMALWVGLGARAA